MTPRISMSALGAMLVLAFTSGCAGPPDTTSFAVVTVERDESQPKPEFLLLSWLHCGKALMRWRVPAEGTLAKEANPIATIAVGLNIDADSTREVMVKALMGAETISWVSATLEVRPDAVARVTVRLGDNDTSTSEPDCPNEGGKPRSPLGGPAIP